MKIAAIDQGTTSTRALLFEDDGTSITLGASKHLQIYPKAGWVEHDPQEILRNIEDLIGKAAATGAEGFALANQGETIVAWDRRTGLPLHNAIVWQDQRTADWISRLPPATAEMALAATGGLPLDPYFSASKLRWILDHVEGAWSLAKSGHLGLATSDSFFIHRLTGNYLTDATTAARTSLFDLNNLAWDQGLCDLFGIPIEILPRIVAPDEPLGDIRGSSGKLPLLAGMVDQIAALFGHGCRDVGQGKVTVGTGAFALMVTGYAPVGFKTAKTVPTVAWQKDGRMLYASDGPVYSAGAAVEWLMRIGLLADLTELAGLNGASAASGQVFFVPALSGLACPHWDRSASGLFIGLDTGTERADMIKAVLEGIAFRIAEVIDAFAQPDKAALSVDGGLVRCAYFRQALADFSQRPLSFSNEQEVTALGAAVMARAVAMGKAAGAVPIARTKSDQKIFPQISADEAETHRARFRLATERSLNWR